MTDRRPDWKPELLRRHRQEFGLSVEEVAERLREISERHSFDIDLDVRTISGHEQGRFRPGPHHRRAYCLLYRRDEGRLGFRAVLPGEEVAGDSGPRDPDGVVRRALAVVEGGSGAVEPRALQDTVFDAWRGRGGGDGGPVVLLVGGYAGSGKSEFARFLGGLTGWPVLDKDSLTRPLVDRLLVALGGEAHDRASELYREKVRPLEYRCLLDAAWDNLGGGTSTILDAPFIAEFARADWMRRFQDHCRSRRVSAAFVWVACDPDSMREHIEFRGAARDTGKTESWDEYAKGLDPRFRPRGPHFVVDNRLGAAIARVDAAREVLGGGGR
ncbi:AAA family ATPase [Streptomyces sp. BI20]|uniref:AAA family ATPase n=1 Tax=Streptomyces sp. BI20 TaxID=3403460 RepID=UPI003C78E2B9